MNAPEWGRRVKAALLVTGLSEGIVQIVVLREVLAGFNGTELLTGVILAGWMALNSIGCFLSSRILAKATCKTLLRMQGIVGATAFFACMGMLAGCSLLASNAHSQIDWLRYSVLSLLVFLPFCVSAGVHYTLCVRVMSELQGYDGLRSAAESYAYDSMGMLIGFLLGTFLLMTRFNPAETALLVLGVNLLAVALASLLITGWKKTAVGLILCGVALYAGLFASGVPDRLFQSAAALRVPLERLEEVVDTRYARLLVTSSKQQYNFYANGYMEGVLPDFDPAIEKAVHFALLMHEHPDKVFIMGGLTAGVLDEVLKHRPVEAVYGDIDPDYLSTTLKYIKQLSGKAYDGVEFVSSDVRSYLQRTADRYDVIILSPPPPATLSTNRYHTEEFFRIAAHALQADGLLCTGLSSPETYAGKNQKRLNSSIFQALSAAFHSTLIVPGDEGVVIAGNTAWNEASLKQNILQRYTDRQLEADLVSPEYIELMLNPIRMQAARASFSYDGLSVANDDYFPSAMQYYAALTNERENITGYRVLDWFSTQPPARLLLMFLLLLLAPLLLRALCSMTSLGADRKPYTGYIAFISGLAGFSGISIITYLYQIKIGSLYGDIGTISAASFCGYALGAIAAGKLKKKNGGTIIAVYLCALMLLAVILLSTKLPLLTTKASFILLILFWGTLNGAVYPLLSKVTSEVREGKLQAFMGLYMLELLGAALGAALTGILLLGTVGFAYTVILIAAALAFAILQLFLCDRELIFRSHRQSSNSILKVGK